MHKKTSSLRISLIDGISLFSTNWQRSLQQAAYLPNYSVNFVKSFDFFTEKYKNLHSESIYYNMKYNKKFLSEDEYLAQMEQGAGNAFWTNVKTSFICVPCKFSQAKT